MKQLTNTPSLSNRIISIISTFNSKSKTTSTAQLDETELKSVWSALTCLQFLPIVDQDAIISSLDQLYNILQKHQQDGTVIYTYLLSQTIITTSILLSRFENINKMKASISKYLDLVRNNPTNYYILTSVSCFFETYVTLLNTIKHPIVKDDSMTNNKKSKKGTTTANKPAAVKIDSTYYIANDTFKNDILPLFKENLSNKSTYIRRSTLSLLAFINQLTVGFNATKPTEQQMAQKNSVDPTAEYRLMEKVFDNCLDVENTKYHTIEGRTVMRRIDNVMAVYNSEKVVYLNQHIYHYLLGTLYIRYTLLWTGVQKFLTEICKKDLSIIFPIILNLIKLNNNDIDTFIAKKRQESLIAECGGATEEENIVELEEIEKDGEDEQDEQEEEEEDKKVIVEEEEDQRNDVKMVEEESSKQYFTVQSIYQLFFDFNDFSNTESSTLADGSFQPQQQQQKGKRRHTAVGMNIIYYHTEPISMAETLIKFVSQNGKLFEDYVSDITTLFLSFLVYDYNQRHTHVFTSMIDTMINQPRLLGDSIDRDAPPRTYSAIIARNLMVAYLEFFAQQSPDKIVHPELMLEIFMTCLDVDDEKVQSQSIQCIVIWQQKEILPYKKTLERLVRDATMREEMTTFIVSQASPHVSVDSDHRAIILQLITRILLSKIYRKGTNRRQLESQRNFILTYLAGFTSQEIKPVIDRIVFQFTNLSIFQDGEGKEDQNMNSMTEIIQGDVNKLPSLDHQVSFLNIAQPMIRQLGGILEPYMGTILHILTTISVSICSSKSFGNDRDHYKWKKGAATVGEVRSLVFRRVALLLERLPKFVTNVVIDGQSSSNEQYLDVIVDIIARIIPEVGHQGLSEGMKQCIMAISRSANIVGQLVRHENLLPMLFGFLPVSSAHHDDILTIMENLLVLAVDEESTAEDRELFKKVVVPNVNAIISSISLILDDSKQKEKLAEEKRIKDLRQRESEKKKNQPKPQQDQEMKVDQVVEEKEEEKKEVEGQQEDSDDESDEEEEDEEEEEEEKKESMDIEKTTTPTTTAVIPSKPKKKKPTKLKNLSKRKVVILVEVSKYSLDKDQACLLLEIMLHFCKSYKPFGGKGIRIENFNFVKYQEEILSVSILTIVSNLMQQIDDSQVQEHVSSLSVLYYVFQSKQTRTLLTDVFVHLGKRVPYLEPILPILVDLNSYAVRTANDTYDFKKMFAAFEKLNNADSILEFNDQQILPLFYNILYFVNDSDYSVRACAVQSANILIDHLKEDDNTVDRKNHLLSNDTLIKLLQDALIPCVRQACRVSKCTAREELLALFSRLLVVTKCELFFEDLKPLVGETQETNFFLSYNDIKKGRRGASFDMLINVLNTGHKLSSNTSFQIFVPLFTTMMVDESDNRDHTDNDMMGKATRALATIAKQMEWSDYYKLADLLLKTMDKNEGAMKFLLRSVCGVLDAFHFYIDNDDIGGDRVAAIKKGTIGEDKLINQGGKLGKVVFLHPSKQAKLTKEDLAKQRKEEQQKRQLNAKKRTLSQEIHDTIVHSLMPRLDKYLKIKRRVDKYDRFSDVEAVVNLPVALAVFKLIELLPRKSSGLLRARLLAKVCAELKSKTQMVRDVCRETLCTVLEVIGAKMFPEVVKEMLVHLHSGYQKHILIFTLYTLLNHLKETIKAECGCIDNSVKSIVTATVDYIFFDITMPDDVSAHKELYSEAKAPHVSDVMTLVAEYTTFAQVQQRIIDPLEGIILQTPSKRLLPKIGMLLDAMDEGLQANKSSTVKDTLILAYNLNTKGLTKRAEDQKKPDRNPNLKKTYEETMTIQANPLHYKDNMVKQWDSFSYIFVELALRLLKRAIRNDQSLKLMDMIDPLVPMVVQSLSHSQVNIVDLSIRVLREMLRPNYHIPSLDKSFKSIVVKILTRLSKDISNQKITSSCFNILTAIYTNRHKGNAIGTNQIISILQLSKQLFDDPKAKIDETIEFVHKIITSKVQVVEIYDIIDIVCNILVRTTVVNDQRALANMFIDFLLYYPMGEDRLKTHITFLIKNLAYETPEGRLSVLKMLLKVSEAFPLEVLHKYLSIIFIPLAARLGNDTSEDCRSLVSRIIKTISGRIGQTHIKKLVDVIVTWFNNPNGNVAMHKLAAQVISLMAEGAGASFSVHFEAILPLMVQHLSGGLAKWKQLLTDNAALTEEELSKSSSLDGWQLVYFIFVAMEKIYAVDSSLYAKTAASPLWSIALEFLNYPHIWVRTCINRIYGGYFTAQKVEELIPLVNSIHSSQQQKKKQQPTPLQKSITSIVFDPTNLYQLTKKTCAQINSQLLTEELGLQLVKNLIFLSMIFTKCTGIKPIQVLDKENEDHIEGDDYSNWGLNLIQQQQEVEDEEEEEEIEEEFEEVKETNVQLKSKEMIDWMFSRLSKIASKRGETRRKVVFRWYAVMVTQLNMDNLKEYLGFIVSPIVKTLDSKVENVSDAEKELAEEVLIMLRKKIGAVNVSKLYKEIEEKIIAKRFERRQEGKLLKINDYAQYKQKQVEKKKKTKENKIKKRKVLYDDLIDTRDKIKVSRNTLESMETDE
ncbi:HEAT repeat-containing protein [Cavenderia fasciculata]|uniref:HEAT repeat-containing protein n=1 Tax=Cavenderia fasciculata TaxID=261658 RepID=F4QEJ1_CACFS|nr:HEAT repeat-containing protein [Cavenderia fasciculata]EGG14102.1 HEAT repeat-containing protein [Cavenderia fasciculata]|eukprot:XP_004350810.1 HEAT repeat-containing protein [Cavenderia fasciculata]